MICQLEQLIKSHVWQFSLVFIIFIFQIVPESVFTNHHDFLLRCAHKARMIILSCWFQEIPYPSIIPRTEGILSFIETTLSIQPQEKVCLIDLPSDRATMSIVSVEVSIIEWMLK